MAICNTMGKCFVEPRPEPSRNGHTSHPTNVSKLKQFCKEEWSHVPCGHCAGLLKGTKERKIFAFQRICLRLHGSEDMSFGEPLKFIGYGFITDPDHRKIIQFPQMFLHTTAQSFKADFKRRTSLNRGGVEWYGVSNFTL